MITTILGIIGLLVILIMLMFQYEFLYNKYAHEGANLKDDMSDTIIFIIPFLPYFFAVYYAIKRSYINYKQSKLIKNGSTSQH